MARKRKILENLKIVDVGAKATGVAKHEGKVVFVENAIPGDVVDVLLTKNKTDWAKGRVQNLKEKSQYRIDAFCNHFKYCGGCKWQNVDYKAQLNFKEKLVKDAIERIGKVSDAKHLPILGAEKTTFYRNKMEYSFSSERWKTQEEIASGKEIKANPALGLHVPKFFDKIVDIEKCYLQDAFADKIRNEVREYAIENDLKFFDIRKQNGFLRTLIIRNTSIGEWMVILSFYEFDNKKMFALLTHLSEKFPEINSLCYAVNPKGNDTLYDIDIESFKGEPYIFEELGGLKFKISPKSFFQTNSYQAQNLYDKTAEFAALTGKEVVYDLYSGTGTIGLYLAKNAKKIVGIETVEDAVVDANINKELNNITNANFYTGEVKDNIEKIIENEGKADVVIVDPPRVGLHPKVVEQLLQLSAPKIVYVSCNPATQARDLEMLSGKYKLVKYQPVDMFPHTYHIENVAELVLK